MEKIKYVPIGAFVALTLRCLIFGASIGDSMLFFPISGIIGYLFFLDSRKEVPVNESLKLQIEELKDSVNALKIGKSFGRG